MQRPRVGVSGYVRHVTPCRAMLVMMLMLILMLMLVMMLMLMLMLML